MGGSKQPITIRFLFASNHNGESVINTNLDIKVKDLKALLRVSWPTSLDKLEDESHLRLICMGQGLFNDNKTLDECHVPVYAYRTPMHVSITPKPGANPSKKGGVVKIVETAEAEGPTSTTCCLCIVC